ncbi:MAG: NAD(P)(+) transhydrogenase (Re/Si-specific) subunit beta, partial [Clostridia bacterium]|nr:NAD(P)(+) transhydrogenase (Re/Si-specific) subunit beta [Clostridia bacterium]
EAKHIIICNYDLKPGYAGVENPLYTSDKVTMMLGDAAKTVDEITDVLMNGNAAAAAPVAEAKAEGKDVKAVLANAKTAIIVPGYGMALAQAQHKVKTLADKLVDKGVDLEYAIHPVAGRMPGHMNVLLAEADVPYESLKEMDEVNPKFKETDVVIIVGANDVVNPAAIVAEGTPIYGMPILRADEAKHIIICNYDLKPGYAGVENPLYTSDKVTMMLGDAAKTVDDLIKML